MLQKASPFAVVLHVNHPREVTKQFANCIKKLRKSGALLLSQTVLMKNINNDEKILKELFEKLIEIGVKPYYLHHLDFAGGTSHFRVSVEEGKELMHKLRGNISGICLPEYVIDTPGGFGKIPVFWFHRHADGVYKATNFQGDEIIYTDPEAKK